MKLKAYHDGTAVFIDRKPMKDLKIEVDCEGSLQVGDKTFLIVNGIATVGRLPAGDYKVKIICKDKVVKVREHIIVTESGTARVDEERLWKIVVEMKNQLDKLEARIKDLEKQVKEHEERISGYSLFGE